MFETNILSTADTLRWQEILDAFSLKDPHYLPGYLRLYEQLERGDSLLHYGGQGFLFRYGDQRNFIIYPFFKRSINMLPFASGCNGLYDIVSPYGYGGPLSQVENEHLSDDLWKGFYTELSAFCRDNHVVSEFSRLHPIFTNADMVSRYSQGSVEKKGSIVYFDLTESEEEILAGMSRQRRSSVLKGLRNQNFQLRSTLDKETIFQFWEMYTKTMERREADQRFLFPRTFFEHAAQILGDHLRLCCVNYQNQLVSASLILRYGGICYDWLAGSDSQFLGLRPNDLGMYYAALEAKKAGDRFLVIGGGRSGDSDSLFEYKSRFSGKFKEFSVYTKIHDQDGYNELVRLCRAHSRTEACNFFPAYRDLGVSDGAR
jgi:hypothetical protein